MRLDRLIPMQPVVHLARAIDFYERLGFVVDDRNDGWGWALLSCGECRIMLDQSINTGSPVYRAAVLYLYPDDIVAYHRAVRERGLDVPELHTTFYGMTEFRIDDPDGNRLWIGQDTGAAA
jgi:catechol 2,3-dioxygenase-like lactoylglutathione lyase family enzyme